ncbi:MAG: ferritin family protein [Longimicrobiales bacterium]
MKVESVAALHAARAAEKQQALYYRALASHAESVGAVETAERLDGLHADEQHHLSRLSARLVELGQAIEDLSGAAAPEAEFANWESDARMREHEEVVRYEALLRMELDERTAHMIREFLEAERRHERELGGKWMRA